MKFYHANLVYLDSLNIQIIFVIRLANSHVLNVKRVNHKNAQAVLQDINSMKLIIYVNKISIVIPGKIVQFALNAFL